MYDLCIFFSAIVPIEQPPSRSWIPLQEHDRTRPAGETLSLQFTLCYTGHHCTIYSFTSLLTKCSNLDNYFLIIKCKTSSKHGLEEVLLPPRDLGLHN